MKTIMFRGLAVFFVLLVATAIMMDFLKMEFGTVDFWQKHGLFFLICISFLPRLTLLFSSVATGGLLWWLGFFFCPRILVATLATVAYFHTNPILVVISWIVALGGEVFEKWGIGKNKFVIKTYRMGEHAPFEEAFRQSAPRPIDKGGVIEAEFIKKD